jgi:hypothetical protein
MPLTAAAAAASAIAAVSKAAAAAAHAFLAATSLCSWLQSIVIWLLALTRALCALTQSSERHCSSSISLHVGTGTQDTPKARKLHTLHPFLLPLIPDVKTRAEATRASNFPRQADGYVQATSDGSLMDKQTAQPARPET